MYLHLGQDVVVRTETILGIFDLDTSTVSKHTRNYLSLAQKEDRVVNVTMELPKSFVVCASAKGGAPVVYISQISSITLQKRTGYLKSIQL